MSADLHPFQRDAQKLRKAIYMKEWRAKNKEHRAEYKKQYVAEHADEIREKRREYLRLNPPDPKKVRERSRRFREANPDRCREIYKTHYWKDVEASRAKSRKKRENPNYTKIKNERAKAYYMENSEALRERSRARDAVNPTKVRNHKLKSKFGITLDQWEAMFEAQGRVCKICGTDSPGKAPNWHTDHCHATGVIRGILCRDCNIGLGAFKDSPQALLNAANYLSVYTAEEVYHAAA